MADIHSTVTELPASCKTSAERMARELAKEDSVRNAYDDGNIPEIDMPKESWVIEPLPESTRPRKDGPGGDDSDNQ